MVLEDCFSRLRSTAVASLTCSAQTTASNVIQKLAQCCGQPQSTAGSAHRVLRPKDAERLVLYLKDINLPKPDKYDTIQLIAFLQQLLTYGGFYDESQEFIGLMNVQVVCSMNPATTVGEAPDHHPVHRHRRHRVHAVRAARRDGRRVRGDVRGVHGGYTVLEPVATRATRGDRAGRVRRRHARVQR
jgi:hypothetical protein